MYKNKNFFESVACAVKGLVKGFKAERNFKIYVVIAVVFLIFNILLKSGIYDYIIYIILACGTFGAEYINTAIERLCDRQCREDDRFVRIDCAAEDGSMLPPDDIFARIRAVTDTVMAQL